MLTTPCPRCGGTIRLVGTIGTGPLPEHCFVDIHPDDWSKRRHAACFSGPGGGLPIAEAA